MKIHEYQARELFEEYGIPTSGGILARTPGEAEEAAGKLGGAVVVKAQVLVGGRGKAGGIKVCGNPGEARKAAEKILGLNIKTIPVEKVMVTRAVDVRKEYYIGFTVDRNARAITLMMSGAGGVEIEELAASHPEKILKLPINPAIGIDETALRDGLARVFEREKLSEQALQTVRKLYTLFREKDCSLVEINPYALVQGDRLIALDAKINFDDNALFKHPEIQSLRNPEEYSRDEIDAREAGLSFVSMEGSIGCIVNGAGLAMATMDLIKLLGGTPANFLDVGGSSNPEKVLNALRIIVRNPGVKAILINIFGGITRCDDIARGILMALEKIRIPVPLVIRLIGTNEKEGREILSGAGFAVADDMTEAVRLVLKQAR